MSRSNDLYKMYEEEVIKNEKANKIIRVLKLENDTLKIDLKIEKNKTDKEIEKVVKPILEENNKLKLDLSLAYQEIDRLKKVVSGKKRII